MTDDGKLGNLGRIKTPRRPPDGQAILLDRGKKKLLIMFLSAAAFVVGCDKEKTTEQQIDQFQAETKQAAQDMKDYTFAPKDEFVKAMQIQLTALNPDLDKLAAKIDSSSDALKAEARPKLQALRDQAAQLDQQLADMRNVTESNSDGVKAGSKKACAAFVNSLTEAPRWLSDKSHLESTTGSVGATCEWRLVRRILNANSRDRAAGQAGSVRR